MMTNLYRPNSRTKSSPLLGVCVVLALSIAALFALDRFTGGVVREAARGAGGAARSLSASVGSSAHLSGFFSSKSALARENDELRQKVALQDERARLLGYIREENTALQGMARLAREEDGITVRVLSSLTSVPYGTFMIGAGTRDGVREGALVLSEGGFLIGVIATASSESASVQSLFAPGAQHGLVAGETAFTAEGRGGGNARASVPRDSLVKVGDIARAAAFGRPAGEILHVESASSSATALLSIRLPVNLETLRFVYVLR